jgi:hypothetical protein
MPQGGRKYMEVVNAVTVIWGLVLAVSVVFAGYLIMKYEVGDKAAA